MRSVHDQAPLPTLHQDWTGHPQALEGLEHECRHHWRSECSFTTEKEQMHYLPFDSPAYRRVMLVGAIGFEPTTPGPPCQCATRLRHAPRMPDRYVRGNIYAITRRYFSVLPLPVAQSPIRLVGTTPALLPDGAWPRQW